MMTITQSGSEVEPSAFRLRVHVMGRRHAIAVRSLARSSDLRPSEEGICSRAHGLTGRNGNAANPRDFAGHQAPTHRKPLTLPLND